MKLKKIFFSVFLSLAIAFSVSITCFCEDGERKDNAAAILCIAHEGDRENYPPCSFEAVKSAFEKGAEYVSASLAKSNDGCFFLCPELKFGDVREETEKSDRNSAENVRLYDRYGCMTDYRVCSLFDAAQEAARAGKKIILDGAWNERDELYAFLRDNGLFEGVILRTDAPEKEITEFISATDGNIGIIREYHGNILFSARRAISFSKVESLHGVCLGTKNSFGVIFHRTVLSAADSQIIIIKTYDLNESGERPDAEFSWNDLTDRGYNCFETDRLDELSEYIASVKRARSALAATLAASKNTDIGMLTKSSAAELKKAQKNAEELLGKTSSADSVSMAESRLGTALKSMTFGFDSEEKSGQGVFSVTPGRVIAIFLVTAGIIGMQMFFYYAQANKKKPGFMKNIFK